ncbi:DUF3301 domain-containing protein [Paraneptunicella aestuarii]|uniref:DUF3301 domain-containing protein n=1 Tax=Paraneptunicella aestuarii TaxID=2831148 RepID=UPI002FC5F1AA|nr:DUF3301 domain-containing protein [Paraneptunicella aestuarii]
MTLMDIIYIMIGSVIAIQFWHIRGITERANRHLFHFCQERNLQLLAVARFKTRIGIHRGKPDWHTFFIFEFSGNGTDSYSGTLEMKGKQVINTDLPAYRVS